MKKIVLSLLVLGSFLATAQAADKTPPKNPEPETMDSNGKPTDYKPGQSSTRYALWYDGTNWNLHMTSQKNDVHSFNATVEAVGGNFTTASLTSVDKDPPPVNIGKGMKIANPNYPKSSDLIFRKERSIFVFVRTTGQGGEAAIQMTPNSDTTLLKFSLQIDGKDHANQIFIGAKGEHPAKTTFTLLPNPPKKEKSK